MNTLKKEQDYAFKKNVYLLGIDEEGTKYWLEQHTWDCDWYWSKGYIETYQGNGKPSKARDIESHSHYTGFIGEKKAKDGGYAHHINESKCFVMTTLSDKESWKLAELMKRAEILADYAGLKHIGTAHITTLEDSESVRNLEDWKRANEELKATLDKVIELLTPIQ